MDDGSKIGHRFGNFHQYYTFHSNDRLDLIPNAFFLELWQGLGGDSCPVLSVLDVGCNEGEATALLSPYNSSFRLREMSVLIQLLVNQSTEQLFLLQSSGDLTIELYQRIRATIPEHITIITLGVDLDSVLIDRANNKVFSLLHPPTSYHLTPHPSPGLLFFLISDGCMLSSL